LPYPEDISLLSTLILIDFRDFLLSEIDEKKKEVITNHIKKTLVGAVVELEALVVVAVAVIVVVAVVVIVVVVAVVAPSLSSLSSVLVFRILFYSLQILVTVKIFHARNGSMENLYLVKQLPIVE